MLDRIISSTNIFQGKIVNLKVDLIEKPDGTRAEREVVEHSDCVGAIALDNRENVFLVRQYRLPVKKNLLEIPAGCIEPGESAEECVKRELQEEIGYLPRQCEYLGGYYLAPGYSTECMHLFLTTDLIKSRAKAEDTDEIEIVKVPLAYIKSFIIKGLIQDSKSIAGLLRFITERDKC